MRTRGFTLVELLLAILLLGLLMAGAWAGINTAVKASRSGEASSCGSRSPTATRWSRISA